MTVESINDMLVYPLINILQTFANKKMRNLSVFNEFVHIIEKFRIVYLSLGLRNFDLISG